MQVVILILEDDDPVDIEEAIDIEVVAQGLSYEEANELVTRALNATTP